MLLDISFPRLPHLWHPLRGLGQPRIHPPPLLRAGKHVGSRIEVCWKRCCFHPPALTNPAPLPCLSPCSLPLLAQQVRPLPVLSPHRAPQRGPLSPQTLPCPMARAKFPGLAAFNVAASGRSALQTPSVWKGEGGSHSLCCLPCTPQILPHSLTFTPSSD